MVFNLILLALTAAIALFHYVQGLFSALISAILVILASVIAVGFHEQLAASFAVKAPEQAVSISIAILFAVVYLIPRLLFDWLVPGNVRFPVLMDKIGAGVLGLVAGLYATGVVALVADALPFGPSFGMYSRAELTDRHFIYMGKFQRNEDAVATDTTVSDIFDPSTSVSLWFHQDDLVVGTVKLLSDNGSLAGDRSFAQIHPDYLTELYGQRLGIQVGARHTMLSLANNDPPLSVPGIYTQDKLTQVDGDIPGGHLRNNDVDLTLRADSGSTLLIIRSVFNTTRGVADEGDSVLRISPGAVRLVLGHTTDHGSDFKDYYPIATLDPRGIAVASRIDDFLFADMSGPRTIDWIFSVDNDHAFADSSKMPYKMVNGAFLEVKRYGVVDLSGISVDYGPPANPDKQNLIRAQPVIDLIAKTQVLPLKLPAGQTTSEVTRNQPGTPLGSSGLKFQDLSVSNKLPVAIDVHTDADSGQISLASARGRIQHRQWADLTVSADTTTKDLAAPGNNGIADIATPGGQVMVQLHCQPSGTSRQWDWTSTIPDMTLSDGSKSYKTAGIWVNIQRGTDFALSASVGNRDYTGALTPPAAQQGNVTDVYIAFFVPTGVTIQEATVQGNSVLSSLNFRAQ